MNSVFSVLYEAVIYFVILRTSVCISCLKSLRIISSKSEGVDRHGDRWLQLIRGTGRDTAGVVSQPPCLTGRFGPGRWIEWSRLRHRYGGRFHLSSLCLLSPARLYRHKHGERDIREIINNRAAAGAQTRMTSWRMATANGIFRLPLRPSLYVLPISLHPLLPRVSHISWLLGRFEAYSTGRRMLPELRPANVWCISSMFSAADSQRTSCCRARC